MNETYWQAVVARDQHYDGAFVYAVRSTGIYCRPSCAARRPRRENVAFFGQPDAAEQAGFRACLRCQPDGSARAEPHLDLVNRVCRHLEQPHAVAPTLDALAAQFGLSAQHLQRTFKRIVGVSPRQYADARRRERLRAQLAAGEPVTEALYEAGYGSSSGFYEQAAAHLGMTPQTYQKGGEAMDISYTVVPCPLGFLLVGATARGICTVALGDTAEELVAALEHEFPAATIARDGAELDTWVQTLLGYLRGAQSHLDLPLDVRATAFQRRVWEALRAIPYGSTRSYTQIAQAIGQPTAARAVARACATNPVALAVPCHRVVRENGDLSGYRWGLARKQALLAREADAARVDTL